MFIQIDRLDRQILRDKGLRLEGRPQRDPDALAQTHLRSWLGHRPTVKTDVTGFDALLQVTARKLAQPQRQRTVESQAMQLDIHRHLALFGFLLASTLLRQAGRQFVTGVGRYNQLE